MSSRWIYRAQWTALRERLNWGWLRVQGLEKLGKNRLDGEWASWKSPLICLLRMGLESVGGQTDISTDLSVKGTAWTKVQQPLPVGVERGRGQGRRSVTCREDSAVRRRGKWQSWRVFRSDLRKNNLSLACAWSERRGNRPPWKPFSNLNQQYEWGTERHYTVEIGQIFLT